MGRGWIDDMTRRDEFVGPSDCPRDLVRRDRAGRKRELSLDDLRRIVADARDGGVSERSVEAVFQAARKIARAGDGDVSG